MSTGIETPCQGGEEAGRVPWQRDLMALSGLMRRQRKAKGLTQSDAGALIGMSERSFRDFENGHKDIKAEDLFRLCGAIGIRVFDPEAEKNRQKTAGSEVV